jgi:hypothetical protein
MSEETPLAKGFRMALDAIYRKNPSGCCCKFDENDEIVELCAAHKAYFDKRRTMTEKPCVWKEEEECWETSCGHAFCLNTGTPSENGMQFCPYCGKPIKEKGME